MGESEILRQRAQLDQARTALGPYLSAARSLEESLKDDPDNGRLLAIIGRHYFSNQEYERAAETLERAVAADPSLIEARVQLGESCLHLGELTRSAAVFRALLDDGVRSLRVCYNACLLPESHRGVDLLAILDTMLERLASIDAAKREDFEAAVAFVKAGELHRAGRYPEVWDLLVTANRRRSERLRRDFAEKTEFSSDDLSRLRAKRDTALDGHESVGNEEVPCSLFILGPSRCGKSTVEILASHLRGVKRGFESRITEDILHIFRKAGVLEEERISSLPPQMYSLFRDYYVRELIERAGSSSIYTNTVPFLIRDAFEIARIIPKSRFIFIKRNIDDISVRIFMQNYHADSNRYSYSIEATYEFVRWYYEMIDLLAELLPDISRVIYYEDMVEDPKGHLDIVADLCGAPRFDGQVPRLIDDRGCAEPYKPFIAAALAG